MSTRDLLNAAAPNTVYMITGTVAFSRIATPVAGEELNDEITRSTLLKRNPRSQRPYTRLQIDNASVLTATNQQGAQIAEAQMYVAKVDQNNPNAQKKFEGINKSKNMPWLAARNPADPNGKLIPLKVEGELARGLRVTLVMRVYHAPQGNGANLEGVICEEPVRWFHRGLADLANAGIVFTEAPAVVTVDEAMSKEVEHEIETPADEAPMEQPVPAPAPAQPIAQPFTNIPVPTPIPTPPVYGYEQPAASPAGIQPPPVNPGGGIQFDLGADPNRRY